MGYGARDIRVTQETKDVIEENQAFCWNPSISGTKTEDGFIAPPSSRTGIFVTGACSGPRDIDRSILQAKSTAFQVHQYVRGEN